MCRDAGTSGILTSVSAFTEVHPDSARISGASERGCACVGQLAAVAASLASLEVMTMLDFVMIATGVAFFVASVLYVLACERM
jgi:hypothetical protein